jgi:hypothetical protein
MEPSRRNQWQAQANRPSAKPLNKPNLLPWLRLIAAGTERSVAQDVVRAVRVLRESPGSRLLAISQGPLHARDRAADRRRGEKLARHELAMGAALAPRRPRVHRRRAPAPPVRHAPAERQPAAPAEAETASLIPHAAQTARLTRARRAGAFAGFRAASTHPASTARSIASASRSETACSRLSWARWP